MKPPSKVVTAFTHARDDLWLPPSFVVGELVVRRVTALDDNLYSVGGIGVDECTVTPITSPTPELIRLLRQKKSEWDQQDHKLAERRGQEDDSFREECIDPDNEVHLVRDDQTAAFSAFTDAMNIENQRLTADRRAEVAELVRIHDSPRSIRSSSEPEA
jgi:hypothetical protein